MERVCGRQEKMEGHCWTGQSPQRAVVQIEEEEEKEKEKKKKEKEKKKRRRRRRRSLTCHIWLVLSKKKAPINRKNYVQIFVTVPLEEITILQLANKFLTRNRNAFVTARYLPLFLCMCVSAGGGEVSLLFISRVSE